MSLGLVKPKTIERSRSGHVRGRFVPHAKETMKGESREAETV